MAHSAGTDFPECRSSRNHSGLMERVSARPYAPSAGLWLVNQVCDLVQARTGPAGSTTRLHMSLDRP